MPSTPSWTEHVIWWHVYPLGFLGADTTGRDRSTGRTLRDLVPWLDHLIDLGANGLALGPVFASSTHGYDTSDYLAVDSRLGTEDDLVHLVEQAHERGIRVMLDGVFNHVGPEFPRLVEARDHPDSAAAQWFPRGDDGGLATFEGHGGLVALDHGNAEVADFVTEVMTHWLGRGVDAWRLDAAYAVPPAFWADVLPRVRSAYPEVFVLGEVLHGDYAAIVAESGMDSVTQYELWQGIWHGIDEVNAHEVAWALTRHDEFLQAFVPYTFVGNHDVTRIASQIDDERHHAHALVLLLLLGGMPSVYYGDEVGLRAVKEERFGGDDAIRPEFPTSPEQLLDLDGAAPAVLALHQELISLRRRHPWLHRASSRTVELTNETMVIEVARDEDSLTVALNLGDEELEVEGTWESLSAHACQVHDAKAVLGPHGWAALSGV